MAIHIVFVATFDDRIEVSYKLPKDRPMPGFPGLPVFQGYTLKRLRVEADRPPVLPNGDITQDRYEEWLSNLGEVTEEAVSRNLVIPELRGLCVDVHLGVFNPAPYGTLLEATVVNVGPYAIGKVQVVWHGRWKPRKDN